MELRSTLGRVRGLGSAKGGTGHWWAQRVTALALVPLVIWFVMLVLRLLSSSQVEVLRLIASPFNTVTLLLFIGVMLYHGYLGIQVIIEDYVHKECMKLALLVSIKFFTVVTGLAGICAVLVFHLSLFSTTM